MKKIVFGFMAVIAMIATTSCSCSSSHYTEEEATIENLTDTTCSVSDTVVE